MIRLLQNLHKSFRETLIARYLQIGIHLIREVQFYRPFGFSGLPEPVDRNTFEEYINLGEVELYRGFTSPEYKRNFMKGEYFAGTGIDGMGIYTAAGENAYEVALAYKEGKDSDCVLRMCLNDGPADG